MFQQQHRLHIPGEEIASFRKLALYSDTFVVGKREVEYAEVNRLYCNVRKSSEGFGYSGDFKLMIYLEGEKRPIKLKHRTAFSTNKTMRIFWPVYDLLQNRTRKYRERYYANELEHQGYIQYDKKIRITAEGVIKNQRIAIDLAHAKAKELLRIGTEEGEPSSSFYKNEPLEVAVSLVGFAWYSQTIRFHAYYDPDIVLDLIRQLAARRPTAEGIEPPSVQEGNPS